MKTMNQILISALVVLAASSAFADQAPATKTLCLQFTAQVIPGSKNLSTASCTVVQNVTLADLHGTWNCSFSNVSGGTATATSSTLNTIATWVSDPTDTESSAVYYDVFSSEDLGSMLLNGMSMSDANDVGFLKIELGTTPVVSTPSIMFEANGVEKYVLNTTASYGACPASK